MAQTIKAAYYHQPTDKTLAKLPLSGQNGHEPANALQLVPNPASSAVQIQAAISIATNATIVISNPYGQTLQNLPLNNQAKVLLRFIPKICQTASTTANFCRAVRSLAYKNWLYYTKQFPF
ncbi:hypothetical protein C7N43_32755 [Sphingobacteriales bacterium UPWRP_1]|nr:hypothetical protein BVG80_01270 [Sphingobacteriales bacterium TSM_CSM]PSJ72719.1 hypothetical protein C7N43_32755 [Sphingobacteriales bacterium UPWRP_1]